MRTALYMAFPIISAVVLLGCTLTAPAPSGNLLQNRQVADVTSAGVFTHLEMLQRIADNNGGNRASQARPRPRVRRER